MFRLTVIVVVLGLVAFAGGAPPSKETVADCRQASIAALIEASDQHQADLQKYDELAGRYNQLLTDYKTLAQKHDSLLADYSSVLRAVPYLGSSRIAPAWQLSSPIVFPQPDPIHCSAFAWGSNTSINCR